MKKIQKRLFDISSVVFIGLSLFPLILVIAILNICFVGRPILFSQKRPGLNGVPFNIYKFRTMNNNKDEHGNLLPDVDRLPKYGKILRSTSLDELPSLFNVAKGDMSLVGPRPLLMEYLSLYSPEQARRHEVRPGVTGWAQVNGRNAISWDDKFKLDVWYVDNQSFLLDLKIIFLTVKKIIIREGISASGEVTMYKFTGNKND